MTQGTAVATRGHSEIIREGANLPQDQWGDARIAAVKALLPSEFQDPASTIALLARSQRSGLDPFIREIHAWKNERGELQFYTARDGWIRISRNDPAIESLEFGLVYEGDSFSWRQEGGAIEITHTGSGFGQGSPDLVGAYCVAHMLEGADHLERRVMNDYKHLLSKSNWRNSPADMLLTRVVSACVKFVSPLGNGIDDPDTAFGYASDEPQRVSMNDKTAELAKSLKGPEPVEAEIVEDEDVDEQVDAENEVPDDTYAVEETPDPAAAFDHFCEFCGAPFPSGRALGGHKGAHRDEMKLAEKIPAGWKVQADRDGDDVAFLVLTPGGEIIEGPTADDTFISWTDAAKWAIEQGGERTAPEPATTEALEEHAIEDEDPEPEPEPEPEKVSWTVTRIQAWIAKHPSIGLEGLQSLVNELFPERRREGRDDVSVFDLSAGERNVLGDTLVQMAEAQNEGL